jgi:hypothetical protein
MTILIRHHHKTIKSVDEGMNTNSIGHFRDPYAPELRISRPSLKTSSFKFVFAYMLGICRTLTIGLAQTWHYRNNLAQPSDHSSKSTSIAAQHHISPLHQQREHSIATSLTHLAIDN